MRDDLSSWFTAGGAILLSARDSSRVVSPEELARLLPVESRLFTLRCHFEEGGPWAGTRDFFRTLLPVLETEGGDLLAKHDYELVHVLPDLRATLGIRNPSLTDLASGEERVRNYPADRAMRIVHGLIDLVIALKERSEPSASRPWVLLCVDYDSGGHITQTFLRELIRRAGVRLSLTLIPLSASEWVPDFPAPGPCRELPFAVAPPATPQQPGKDEAARLAQSCEAGVDGDILASTGRIPDLVRLWRLAERPDKTFEWQFKALHAFNTLGLYVDAIRYGEPARELFRRSSGRPQGFLWGLFFKLFMCYTATNELAAAQRIAEEDVLTDRGEGDAAMRIRLGYLMAMLHARYLPVRDLAKGEQFLELGLGYLHQAGLPEDEHFFQLVFNRNGLAMIRSFQGRFGEALELCRDGLALLEQHLDPGRHRLHRSVLFYNMAQVYAQIEQFDLAIRYYSEAMGMDPNYSEYYNERGNLLLKLGRLEEAQRDYRRAIELGPPYFEVWSNLGQCHRVSGRMEEAIAAYDRSLDLQPDQPMGWVVRAQALEALGRLTEAIAAYDSALELQPGLWPARAGRAVLLYEQGRVNDCLADLDRAIAVAPDEPEIHQNRAVALSDLGRYEDATRDLRRYLELRPDAADRGEVEARLRELESALATAGS